MNFSIITPTFNRSKLVEDLLSSLFAERNRYEYGNIEVLIIDSSNGIEKEKIHNSCIRFNALYLEGPDSVRKKRNIGITSAKYENIIFLDSDVFVVEGFLNEYDKTYKCNISNDKLGGILGYTEFIGEKNFWWKVLELTSLVDSFSFARKYPFHSWTIANNVSFKTDILKKMVCLKKISPLI
ncbi:hypothetical protein AGMMS49938_13510 [Fibrobacterales bacterium]|nr:hypothetical protein AGMMS49938_13510 [Fibrobacterales bacterium]